MKTINEQEFRALCEQVRQEAPALLQGVTDPSLRTRVLLRRLLERLCQQLDLDVEAQMQALEDRSGFALLQTLEEHMQPEFFYSAILDRCLLSAV